MSGNIGISKGLLVGALVATLVCSVVASYGVSMIVGPKGDKGEQGPQGIQGVQGPKGDKGDTGERARYAGPFLSQLSDLLDEAGYYEKGTTRLQSSDFKKLGEDTES